LFVGNFSHPDWYQDRAQFLRNPGTGGGAFQLMKTFDGGDWQESYASPALGDYDNDGDLDLLVVNLNDSPRLLRNDGPGENNWLTIEAKLHGGKVDAIGARVTVKTGSLVQIHDLVPVTGYLSQADPRAHFGLGESTSADVVEIRWPDGRVTQLKDVRAGQILPVVQEETRAE